MSQPYLSKAFTEKLEAQRTRKQRPNLPPKLVPWQHFGKIPGWVLLLMFGFLMFVWTVTYIDKDFWSRPILHSKGQKITAYVLAEHTVSRGRHSSDYIIEASFISKDGYHQVSEVRATYDYYQSAKIDAPVEIVYNPRNPEQAYLVHGEDEPQWVIVIVYLLMFPLAMGTIVRYHKVLYKRL
jgi:hypothetical protein